MLTIKHLPWDSDLFGFKVGTANLTVPVDDAGQLREGLVSDGYRLCYLFGVDRQADSIAAGLGAGKVDDRTLLHCDLGQDDMGRPPETGPLSVEDWPQLRALALQSAEFSRFRTDPQMPADGWIRLYEKWIRNSLNGLEADAVLVERVTGEVAGLVTVKVCGTEGTIGLLAVGDRYRGHGMGTKLLDQAGRWFRHCGVTRASVVTQGGNVPALNLYRKAGYTVHTVTSIYHWWL